MSKKDRPSVGAGMKNWRNSDLPFAKKFAVMMKNELIKARKLQNCCGHPGEPGC
jgi:hypothetical protein